MEIAELRQETHELRQANASLERQVKENFHVSAAQNCFLLASNWPNVPARRQTLFGSLSCVCRLCSILIQE